MTLDRFSLSGKTAFLSGATGYLGRAMARALAEAGAHVFLNGRNPDTCDMLAAELCADGFKASAAPFDITCQEQITRFFRGLEGVPLNILINNAYAGAGGTVETASARDFRASYEIAVISAQLMLQAALPNLRLAVDRHSDASVINIASMYAVVSPDLRNYDTATGSSPPFYGAAKAALLQYTRYAACEFGKEGIRVNALAPGPFPGPKVCEATPEFTKRLAGKVPMNRIGNADEIGGPVVFLASPASSFVNGATLSVDGGWTSW